MARTNLATRFTETTHEGAPAARMTAEQALRRSVLSCLLWEREFYEDGEEIAGRIRKLANEVKPETLAALAGEARTRFKLRHVPLLLLVALIGRREPEARKLVADAIAGTVRRADEPGELIALYRKLNGRADRAPAKLTKQMKAGLAAALPSFDAYQLAKYDRDGAVKLRDVFRLVHPKPANAEQAELWRRLVKGELESPDTWEVALSAGADKRETFERLLREGKLGYLALLRNLRNMTAASVDTGLIRDAILARKGARDVLPFRFVAAARACPQMEPALDTALLASLGDMPKLPGKTVVLVDVSGSMNDKLSSKSDLTRRDAAATLASILPGEDVRVFAFADTVVEIPRRMGMAGVDAINQAPRGSTRLFDAVAAVKAQVPHDRMVVITDEQATDPSRFGYWIVGSVRTLPDPLNRGYMVNVASARNGVGYGKWTHIDGFSEAVLTFIREHEAAQ